MSARVKSAGSTASAAILPSPPRPNRADRPTNQRARLPSPWQIVWMSAPISGLILVRMSTVLLLHWHTCRISRRPTNTSNIIIILGYKVQSPPAYNTNPSNATLPPPPPSQMCSKQGAIEGKPSHVGLARQGWTGGRGAQYRLVFIRARAPAVAVCLVIACVQMARKPAG